MSSPKSMKPQVIFEDSQILVLEKPAGMVVNRAETTRGGETVQDWIARNFQFPIAKQQAPLISSDQSQRNGIVHRLDKETSGILLVAKTSAAFENLQKQFKERRVKKKYLALVHGKVKPEEGEISAPVGRIPWSREKFGVVPGGRVAKTRYKILRYYDIKKLGKFSLLELTPTTGRTHQIRVHLKYLGYPIVADEKYAGRKTSREDRKIFPRMFLHASYLGFFHPRTGKLVEFSLPLPPDLKIDEKANIF